VTAVSLGAVTFRYLLRRPSAVIPIAMSVAAFAVVVMAIAFGVARPSDGDEGAAAHIWQLLMVGQLPIVAFFAISWVPRVPSLAIGVLGVQFAVALAALGPVFLLGL
jgi:hypothetical protein